MKLPDAILIDLDDTIINDAGCADSCWRDACLYANGLDPAMDAAVVQRTIREHADVWWADADRHRRGRLDLRAATTEIVGDALLALGLDKTAAPEIANHYRDLREERAALFDGAVETLAWLRACGVRLGMMTNGAGPAQRAKIERFALAAHFDHIVIEGEFGVGKPDRRVFETLLRELRARPKAAWAIGDNPAWDVYPAMELGIFGVWVNPSGSSLPADWREPDRVIATLSELRSDGQI